MNNEIILKIVNELSRVDRKEKTIRSRAGAVDTEGHRTTTGKEVKA
jgi:hypothetical protein